MVLSLGTPGHCPGFIMKWFQSIALSLTSLLNPLGLAQYDRMSHIGICCCIHPFTPVVQ